MVMSWASGTWRFVVAPPFRAATARTTSKGVIAPSSIPITSVRNTSLPKVSR